MFRKIRALVAIVLIVITTLIFPFQAKANDLQLSDEPTTIPSLSQDGVIYPDWANLTFSDFGVIPTDGGVDLSEFTDQLGYDASRFWHAGDKLTNILNLGDFVESTNLGEWTLDAVSQFSGIDLNGLSLADFGTLSFQSIEDLVDQVPLLGDYSLKDIKAFSDLVSGALGSNIAAKFADYKLLDLADNVNIGTLSLDQLDLSKYPLNSIPNLDQVQFGNLVEWQKTPLSAIPGLEILPIINFLKGLNLTGFLAKIDIVYGEKEARRLNTITGSYKEGFAVPCNQDSCAHLELTDALDTGIKFMHGKQWISGKSQKVKGGKGFLSFVNGGREPTGRHPFGDAFKVVLTDVDESEGKANFGVYFRICVNAFFTSGCTPYFIGPFPWFSQREKDLIFIGFDRAIGNGSGSKGQGDLSEAQLKELLKLFPPDPDASGQIAEEEGKLNWPTAEYDENAGYTPNNCEVYKGVHIGALKEAFSVYESGGNYSAVGIYHNCVGCTFPKSGHALGRYQISSYREDLEPLLKSKSGGVQFWNDLASGKYAQNPAAASKYVLQFFSIEEQERLSTNALKTLIDKHYKKGLRGNALLTEVAREYSAGAGYKSKLATKYNQKLASAKQKCLEKSTQHEEGENTGTLTACKGTINLLKPTTGTKTSGFGWRGSRMHNGIDVANAVGTSITAVADGQIIDTVTTCHPTHRDDGCGGGYGNRIYLQHCNGWVTRYAHLSKLNVKKNQVVKKGSTIANMGNSGSTTGPHLHFEIRVNEGTTPVNPEKYIKF